MTEPAPVQPGAAGQVTATKRGEDGKWQVDMDHIKSAPHASEGSPWRGQRLHLEEPSVSS